MLGIMFKRRDIPLQESFVKVVHYVYLSQASSSLSSYFSDGVIQLLPNKVPSEKVATEDVEGSVPTWKQQIKDYILGSKRSEAISKKDAMKIAREMIADEPKSARLFSFLQVLTASFGAFAHGGNDVRYGI